MNIKKIALLLFLVLSNFLTAQELVSTYQHNYDNIKNLYRIADETNKRNILIFQNKEKVDYVLFDETFNSTKKLTFNSEEKPTEYLGFSVNNAVYYTYWKKDENTLEVTSADFSGNNIQSNTIPFTLDSKEKVVSMLNQKNVFYILTVIKNSSLLNLYVFNQNNFEKKSIDCSSIRLIDSENKATHLWGLISEKKESVYKDGFRIFNNTSTTINTVFAAQKKKIYTNDDNIIMGLDVNNNYSQYLFINLKDYSISRKAISKERTDVNDGTSLIETNSFLINDKIFVIKFEGEIITVIVKDFENNTLKKISYTGINTGDYINSDLIEENGSFSKRETIEKTAKFIRKAVYLNTSVSGYYQNGNYYLTIGGVSYPQQQAPLAGMFGLVGAIVGTIIEHNSQSSVASYADKKIIYFKTILNSNLEGSKEKLGNSKLDNLRLYVETNKTNESFLFPFEFQNNLILTGVNKKESKLLFYKF